MKITNNSWSVKQGFSRIRETGSGDESYLTGEVFTPDSIVSIYSQGGENAFECTRLDLVHKGKCFTRNYNKRFSKQYIVTLAKRFAKEIITTEEESTLSILCRDFEKNILKSIEKEQRPGGIFASLPRYERYSDERIVSDYNKLCGSLASVIAAPPIVAAAIKRLQADDKEMARKRQRELAS